MARLLVDTLAGDYDAGDYEDDYRGAVEALVQAKLEGGEIKKPPEAKESTGEVVDLLAALQRSVDAAKSSRGESTDEADEDEAETDKKAAKKKSTKKAAAKKPPAKKSTAKKTAAKKKAS